MRINQELRFTKSKGTERYLIVAFSFDGHQVSVSDLTLKTPKKPIALNISYVHQKIDSKDWELVDHDFPDFLFNSDESIPPKWANHREEAKKQLSGLIENKNMINEYLFGSSKNIFEMLIKSSGKSRKYIHTQIMRWFRYGGMDNALLPHYAHCGINYSLPEKPIIKEDGTVCLEKKPGKPTLYGNPYRGTTLKDLELIKKFCKKIPNETTVYLMDLYKKFVAEDMTIQFQPQFPVQQGEEFEMACIAFPRQHLISLASFKYYVKKCVPELIWLQKRVGKLSYDKDHKGKPGIARKLIRHAGQRFEIDATIADVYIKYPYSADTLLSCGRPVIFFVIDTYSGMIVGFHICFDGPNWNGATQALFNAFENKVEFCRRWGVQIDEKDWPCSFICNEIVFDRGGENSDKNLGAILKAKIGIEIMKLAAYHRGDCKGTVEKTFDIALPTAIKFDPGKVEKIPSKEKQHASRSPFLEFDEFMKKIIKIIINKNNFSRKEAHNFLMESTNVGYTPRDIWNHFMNNIIHKPTAGIEQIRFALLPESKATVTDKGIFFNGLYFSNKEIEKKRWLDEAKNIGRFKIDVRYSDTTTNYIWHYDKETKAILTLDLLDRSEAYKSQIWANVLHRLELKKHELAHLDESRFNQAVLLEMDLSEMDKVSKKRNKKMTRSEAKGIAPDINVHKTVVIEVQRNNEAKKIISDLSKTNQEVKPETEPEVSSGQDLTDPTVIY